MASKTKVRTTVPLLLLFASALNPRKSFDEAKLEELAQSILAQGVLQNLVARPVDDKFEVVAGGRRLRALQRLAESGRIPETYDVPVSVRELTDDEALAVAITENANREGVHPMEQAEAFLQLFNLGHTADEISVMMGVDRTVVGRQLQLAQGVSETTRQLFLAGTISLAQASALTLISKEDQERYIEANTRRDWEEDDFEFVPTEVAEAEGYELHPDAVEEDDGDGYWVPKEGATPKVTVSIHGADWIRRQIVNASIPLDRALFELESYTAEGGTITSDMFGLEGFFNNKELFMKLQREAVAALTVQLGEEGVIVHNEDTKPSYEHFASRKGHVTLYLDPQGRLERNDDFGPKVIELRNLVDGKLPQTTITGEPKKAPQNKKRMRLEDKALNRAAEHSLLTSWRRTLEFFILSILGISGTRLKVDNPWSNPHDGYHEPATGSELEGFYTALELAGVKLDQAYGAKEGDPVRRALGYTTKNHLPEILSVLSGYSDDALQRLVQSFMAAMIAPIADGVLHEAHNHLLAVSQPDMHDFFTPDTEYLEACKNAELTVMLGELAVSNMGLTKKGNVEYIAKQEAYVTWLPERLRAPKEAHVEPDPEEAPFETDTELAEAA